MVYKGPMGHEIAAGFDGQESWRIHPGQQPKISHDPNSLPANISEDILALLSLDLRGILRQVHAIYQLDELPEAEVSHSHIPVRHFVAERRSGESTLPQRVELWFDPETDQLEQILCIETGLHRRPTLRISLVATDPLPTDWFSAEAHLPETLTP